MMKVYQLIDSVSVDHKREVQTVHCMQCILYIISEDNF